MIIDVMVLNGTKLNMEVRISNVRDSLQQGLRQYGVSYVHFEDYLSDQLNEYLNCDSMMSMIVSIYAVIGRLRN